MLTARGWWFFVVLLLVLALALWTEAVTQVLVCLTLLTWFLATWLLFAVQARLVTGRLRVVREVWDECGPVTSLWVGRAFDVRVRLQHDRRAVSPYVRICDWVPYGIRRVAGTAHDDGDLSADQPLTLRYHVVCPVSGLVRFEGLGVHIADKQGFFYHYLFVHDVRCYRVLPPMADVRGRIPVAKRHNLLPLLGTHRLRRPGTGSELLDLRDYLPGDPPKTIAWKASARRDRLMTKEFESEVPVRCTLFVDTANSVRVGSAGSNALVRLVVIAGAVAQASAGARDLPACACLTSRRPAIFAPPAVPATWCSCSTCSLRRPHCPHPRGPQT
jgi:uncharacterized protein (DUF58 family)